MVSQETTHRGSIFRETVSDVVELFLNLTLDLLTVLHHGTYKPIGHHAIHVVRQVDRQFLVNLFRLVRDVLGQVNFQYTNLGGFRVGAGFRQLVQHGLVRGDDAHVVPRFATDAD